MPNFPSIYLELQELWRRLRRLEGIYDDHERRITELERITQCMDHIETPTNSTVFNCDVRISGSANPQLYIGPNATDNGPAFNPQNELLVVGKAGDAYMSTTDGTNRAALGTTAALGGWVGTTTDSTMVIRKNNVGRINITGDTSTGTTEIVAKARVTNLPPQSNPANRAVVINDAAGNLESMSFEDVVSSGGGGLAGRQVFTTTYWLHDYSDPNTYKVIDGRKYASPSGSFTVPKGARFIKITCIGGGGGGGGGARHDSSAVAKCGFGGGGGGGGLSVATWRVSDLTFPLRIFVGKGGIPGKKETATDDPSAGMFGLSSYVMDKDGKRLCWAGGGWGGHSGLYHQQHGNRGPGNFTNFVPDLLARGSFDFYVITQSLGGQGGSSNIARASAIHPYVTITSIYSYLLYDVNTNVFVPAGGNPGGINGRGGQGQFEGSPAFGHPVASWNNK